MQEIGKLYYIQFIFDLERLIFTMYPVVQIIVSWIIFMKTEIRTIVLY